MDLAPTSSYARGKSSSSSSETNEFLMSSDEQCSALEFFLFSCCGINMLRPGSQASALNMAVLVEPTRMTDFTKGHYLGLIANGGKALFAGQPGDSDDELCGIGFVDSDDEDDESLDNGSVGSDK
jgi:hypothetical protein